MGFELTFHLPGDIADFGGAFFGSAEVKIVPEPATLALLAIGALAGLRRRRRGRGG